MSIRIGNQTAHSAMTVTQPFEYAVANGFDAFEWFPDQNSSGIGWTENDISGELRTYIKNTALVYDIALFVHASWKFNPLKAEAYELLQRSIKFAEDIGASLLNIHLYSEEELNTFAESIISLIEGLPGRIRLSIENTPDTRPEDFNELFRYLRNTYLENSTRIGMCLDLGHANLCNTTRNDYLKFFDRLDQEVPIIHMHMHENYGDSDTHLTLFTGPAGKDPSGIKGLIDRIKRRNFSGSMILEQWPQPEGLLVEARNRLLKMIGK
ncbi:MAG: TIM barrel protein [Nitrospirota bacterium]